MTNLVSQLFKTYQEAVNHIKATAGINGLCEECAIIIENGNGPGYYIYWDAEGIFN